MSDERGATAIEFAICLPLLLMMVIGIWQFGWAQHTRSSIRFAMEQASRQLLLDPDTTQATLQTFVTNKLAILANTDVTVNLAKTTTVNGRIATLTANYTQNFGVPGLASFSLPYSITVTTALRKI